MMCLGNFFLMSLKMSASIHTESKALEMSMKQTATCHFFCKASCMSVRNLCIVCVQEIHLLVGDDFVDVAVFGYCAVNQGFEDFAQVGE